MDIQSYREIYTENIIAWSKFCSESKGMKDMIMECLKQKFSRAEPVQLSRDQKGSFGRWDEIVKKRGKIKKMEWKRIVANDEENIIQPSQ